MSSRISDLNPVFQPVATLILAEAGEEIAAEFPGSTLRPSVTFRDLAAQAEAKAAGLSQLSVGMHQIGFAMDVAVINEGGDYVIDGSDRRYAIFGRIVQAHGCIWGGAWHQPDWDHCESRMNGNAVAYLEWLEAHRLS